MDTRDHIMAAAKAMAQSHGYNGLSFRVIAKEVGVKSASIHYHFPTKGDLGEALALRYRDDAKTILADLIKNTPDPRDCLKKYTDIFRSALERDNRMCLCGFMAAEHDDLPSSIKIAVIGFADDNISWLSQILSKIEPSQAGHELHQRALAIFAAVGGAQLTARGRGSLEIYDQVIEGYRASGLIPHNSYR